MIWFPGMSSMVGDVDKSSLACQSRKVDNTTTAPLKMSDLPKDPWEKVAIDFISISANTNEHILVVQDRYSRYPVVDFVTTTLAKATIPKLDRIFSDSGVPNQADSSNGTPFQSVDFREYMHYVGAKHHKITPLWPQANQSEKFMKNLKALLQTCHNERLNYKQEVFKYLRAYRATPHPSTNKSPADFMFNGRRYKTRQPALVTKVVPMFDDSVRARDNAQKQKQKAYADKCRHANKFKPLKVGDGVLVQQLQLSKQKTIYEYNPYTITAIKGTMATARCGDHTITRNVSQYRRIHQR